VGGLTLNGDYRWEWIAAITAPVPSPSSQRHQSRNGVRNDDSNEDAYTAAGVPRPQQPGRVLARLLHAFRGKSNVVVLGLPQGGIPVAWEVAAAFGTPFDAFVVRKLGAPGHEEFAVGAMALGGRVVVNDDVLRGLSITPEQLREVAEREGRELVRREASYRGGRPPADVTGKTVILVDDGLATGVSMLGAVQALRERELAQIAIAIPAAPESTWREFAGLVDDVVCASMPHPFLAVGESYWDFAQVSDEEVRELLETPTTPASPTAVSESPADHRSRQPRRMLTTAR
jgi:predicted phosphoribosyltransferase